MWGGFGLYAAMAKPEETIPLLLARAHAGAEAIARKKTPFVTSDVLLALVRLCVILGPELDPLVEWHTTGIMPVLLTPAMYRNCYAACAEKSSFSWSTYRRHRR